MNIAPKIKLGVKVKDADEVVQARLIAHKSLIEANARLGSIEAADSGVSIEGAVQAVVGAITLVMPLAGVVDLSQEKARLTKEISKLDDEIGKIEKKLSNSGFVAKAPAAVVEENREKVRVAEEARGKVQDALSRIEAI